MITQEINLNLIPSSDPVIVHMNQYDEGKGRLIAHLYNGSSPYVPVNATVKVQGTKPDDKAFQYYCDISGSTVTIDINIQMTAVAGRTPTQLIVTEYTGITGSFAFILDIQPSTLQPLIDVSETDLPIYTEEAQEAAQRAVQAAGAAEDSADRAASWSSNPPYIGANDNWFVYDINTEQFVDSGILARGTDGERGSLWYRGTAVSGKSADPTVFPTGIADALPGDMYLNVTEGAIYHCVTGGSASVATWVYDFTLTGGGGGGGTDNYNDLINQPKVNGVTLVGNKTSDDLGINSNIMLSSIMHIGGETQRTVHEALEALKDNGGGMYPYLYIDSEAGATVTVDAPDGSTIIPTPAGSGHWECELPAYGVYVIHSVLSGQGDATYSLTVDDVKEYHVTDSHYDFTIYVIADSGSTVRVSAGTEVYTGTGTGSVMPFVVHQPSTVYTIEETLDGYTDSDTVTSAASSGESTTVTVHVFTATLNISTTSASLYGKSISIMKDGVVVGSTAFNNSGQATYTVHETGIYTLTCDGYTGSATVTTETTYPVSILAGLDLASWISAGSTTEHPLNPSSYADFAALEADEEAIRQLMTVHASVDYLAQATAGDSLMEDVINSDVCAKWINLRDYALDTLYANSDIASEMDTADKYGYGDWVYDGTSWGAKGNVPIMTSNTAPYGEAVATSASVASHNAYLAFDGNDSTNAYAVSSASTTGRLGYKFPYPVNVKEAYIKAGYGANTVCKLSYSDDGSTWTDDDGSAETFTVGMTELTVKRSQDNGYHIYWSISFNAASAISFGTNTLQFYGRELKPLVPVMTDSDKPKGEAFASNMFASYYPWKAFDGNKSAASGAWAYYNNGGNIYPVSVGYDFKRDVLVKYVVGYNRGDSSETYAPKTFKVQGYRNNEWADLTDAITNANSSQGGIFASRAINVNDVTCEKCQLYITDGFNNVEVMVQELQFYGFDYSEKEFAQDSNRLTIYDHGVELKEIKHASSNNGWSYNDSYTYEGLEEKLSDSLYLPKSSAVYKINAFATEDITFEDFVELHARLDSFAYVSGNSQPIIFVTNTKANLWASGTYDGYIFVNQATPDYSLDISSIQGTKYLLFLTGATTVYAYLQELWLE